MVLCAYAAPTARTNLARPTNAVLSAANVSIFDTAQNKPVAGEISNTASAFDMALWNPSVILPETIVQAAPPARTLPALPGAIFMTLLGVGCILFVRERRTLVTVLAGVFILSQYGIQILPKLSARLTHGKLFHHHLSSGHNSIPFQAIESKHPAGRSDALEFIGLLHRLAGSPEADGSFIHEPGGLKFSEYIGRIFTGPEKENVRTHLFSTSIAFLSQITYTRPTLRHYLERSITFIVFSPAFIFANLSRGPPNTNL